MEAGEMSEAISVDNEEVPAVETAGDVSVVQSVSRDPDTIVKEIEQTRAELASAIDAIADRISPKKAAARGAHAVRAKVGGDVSATGPTSHPSGSAVPIAPIAAAVGIVAVVVVIARRRRR